MTGLDTYGPPAPEEQGPPAQEQFYPVVEQGPRIDREAKTLYTKQQQAIAAGRPELAEAYKDEQRKVQVLGQGLSMAQGQQAAAPLSTSTEVDPDLEIYRQMYAYMEREGQFRQIFEQHNVGELNTYLQTVVQDYKAQQDAPAMADTANMTIPERVELMKRLEPVMRDPNELAEIRQRLTQLDQAMKAVDPENRTISVFNHPKTARIAKWLARESSATTPGLVASGEQELDLGEGGWEGFPMTMAFAEGVTDVGLNLLGGVVEGTGWAMDAITGGKVGWAGPTNYIEDESGNLVFNGGKIPSVVSTIAAVNAQLLNRNVEDYVAKQGMVRDYVNRVQAARDFEHWQASGGDKIVRGASSVIGMGFGFGLPAGAAMRGGQVAFGKLMNRGLMRMAESGSSSAMIRLTKVLGNTAGAAAGNGLLEMTAFGRQDGLDKAFMHGMAMAPVLMLFGALGRRTERALKHPLMPKFAARGISGALEGVGFGALEAHQQAALWDLVKDPSMSTWQIYAKNMLGFAIFKAGMGRSVANAPGFEQAGRAMTREQSRTKLAEDLSRQEEKRRGTSILEEVQGPEVPEGFRFAEKGVVEGREPTVPEGERGEYQIKGRLPGPETQMEQARRGELQEGEMVKTEEVMAQRTKKQETQGRDPLEDPDFLSRPEVERRAILEGGTARERRQRAESFEGPERREGERRAVTPKAEKPRLSPEALSAELARLKAEGPTSENRARIAELMQQERGRLTEAVGETHRQLGEQLAAPEPARVRERQAAMRPETPAEYKARQALEKRVKKSGAPRELLLEYGDVSRAIKAARTPEEAVELEGRLRAIRKELDALEIASDPVMNATLREILAEQEVREMEVREEKATYEEPQRGVDPEFGERYGPHSLQEAANPYRQLEDVRTEAEKKAGSRVRESEILTVLKGRSGFKGIRIGKWRIPIGIRKSSAVQIAIRAGRAGRRRALGVFKIFENLTRTKEGMDLVVSIHEWGHAMMRQVLFGHKRASQQRAAEKEMWDSMSEELQAEMRFILRDYPGSEKMAGADILSEAWAEWHARNILNDATLRQEAPKLSMEWDAWLRNQPHLMEQYRPAKELTDLYRRQGARERVTMISRRKDPKVRKIVREAIGGDVVERALATAEQTGWDAWVKSFFDDMHLLKKSQRKWLELSDIDVRELSVLDDPARLYDILAMTASKQADAYITQGRFDLGFKRTGEGLTQIMDDVTKGMAKLDFAGKSQKRIDFIDYVVATRALELLEPKWDARNKKWIPGKKQALPKSDFLQAQKEIIEANPEFRGLADRMKLWSDGLLDLVAEAGNLDPADLQKLKDFGTVYIPFIRALEGTVKSRFGRGVAEKGSSLKRTKGGTQEIQDPMEAMMETTRTMIVKAHQQMVMKALYKMTLTGDVGGLATRIKRSNVPDTYRLDQVFRQTQKKLFDAMNKGRLTKEQIENMDDMLGMFDELIKDANLSDQLITLFSQKAIPVGEGNVVMFTPRLTTAEIQALPKHRQAEAIKQNGKMQWLELDPDAYTALLGLDQPVGPTFMDNVWMKWMFYKPKQWVRLFATDANPAFVAANAIRDILSAPVFSSAGKPRPWDGLFNFIAGGATVFATSRLAKAAGYEASEGQRALMDAYNFSGAKTASIFDEGVRRQMRGEVTGLIGGARETFTKAVEGWKNWLGSPESFIRIAEFKRVHAEAKAANKSDVEAAMEALEAAKEATVNFARAGSVARGFNQMIPYFSASFAGNRKMWRSLAGMDGKTDAERGTRQGLAFGNAAIAITAPAFANWFMNAEEDWYRDLPEWRKRHFLNTKWGDTILSMPLPFELGIIAGSLPVALAEHVTDDNPIAILPTMGQAMFPYLDGIGSLLPPGVKAAMETATGHDLYLMRQQTPYWIGRTRAPEDQMRRNTAIAYQDLFQTVPGLNKVFDNPIELQQFFGTLTAGASTQLAKAIDEISGAKDHPGLSASVPGMFGMFLNRFARQTAHGPSRTVSEFYRELPKVEMQAKRKTATPADKRRLRDMNRDRNAMGEIRRRVEAGQLSRIEGDRMIFEIANRRMEGVR